MVWCGVSRRWSGEGRVMWGRRENSEGKWWEGKKKRDRKRRMKFRCKSDKGVKRDEYNDERKE